VTKDQIQTLLSDSGCIESCLSGKMLLAVIVQLLFAASGIPTSGDRLITEEGDGLITEEGDKVIRE